MRITALALSFASALALISSPASAQQQYNGTWNVEVLPQQGSCNRSIRFPVVIQNGQVRYGGAEGIGISGAVTRKGVIRGNVAAGVVQASVVGRLSRRSGSGTWAASGSVNCSGQWRAARIV
jgi:hypothetical protein